MERKVKERLIGAGVLLAAAIILIPEMLSGPKEEIPPAAQPTLPAADAPIKSYSIDLNRPQASRQSAPTTETTAAPPVETLPPPPTVTAQEKPVQEKPVEKPAPEKPIAQKPAPEAVVKHEPPPVATPTPPAENKPKPASAKPGSQWAVQVGSFASKATAEKVAQSLKADGYTAFVMPVTSGAATLYRVRVGPVSQRGDADALQRKLKPTVPQATVVAHP